MTPVPVPVVFDPILKPKPWGGQRLADLFGKVLPEHTPIGESWELASLPEAESRVRGGPLAGRTLAELVELWGAGLLGDAPAPGGRFPVLIKFLDACQNLSVQVHPRPRTADPWEPGVKHEAWYVLHAEPGAHVYIGARDGVGVDDFRRAGDSPAVVDLLRCWDARPGQFFYLPSGTPHALGAGVVVAEIQTPSDVTYRLYDWGRVDLDGRPRALHMAEALECLRCDTPVDVLRPPCGVASGPLSEVLRYPPCGVFQISRASYRAGFARRLGARMRVLIVLTGRGHCVRSGVRECDCRFAAGDVLLVPADATDVRLELHADTELLEVTVSAGPPGAH
ncbi:MAG: type I phosphomannose isomerase catalytic subunit [Planctomycetota bacterium]